MKRIRLFWLMLMLLMSTAFTPLMAQETLTVNEGTATNSYVPFYGGYAEHYNRIQFIIPSTSLTDMDGAAISKLVFYASQSSVTWGNARFEVRLMETPGSTFSSTYFLDTSSATLVYSGALSISGSQMAVDFSTEYEYGGGNLLIEIKEPTKGTYVSSTWYGINANSSSLQANNSSSMPSSGNHRNFLPKTTFTYEFAGAVAKPKNFTASNIGKKTATLSWDAVDGADSYELYYSTSSTAPADDATATVSNLTGTSHNLTGLTTGMTYYAYVRTVIGGEKSKWSSACEFAPGLMTFTINDGTTTNSNIPLYGGSAASYYTHQFIIPRSDLEDIADCIIKELVFYSSNASVSWGNAEYDVNISETTSSNFNNSYYINTSSTKVFSGKLSVSNNQMKVTFTTDFEYSGENNLLVEIWQTATGTNSSVSWYGVTQTDKTGLYHYSSSASRTPTTGNTTTFLPKTTFAFVEPDISKPKNLTASNIGKKTATLSWDAVEDANSYELYYSTSSTKPADDATATVSNLTGTSQNLFGLIPATTYYAYVRTVIGGEKSKWSAVCKFTAGITATGTVNDGTNTNNKFPLFTGYLNNSNTNNSEFIIPKETLENYAGGAIRELTFYTSNTSTFNMYGATFDVYLKETDKTTYSGYSELSQDGATTVYSGILTIAGGKMVITFDTPFEYSGDNNLLVGMKRTSTATSQNTTGLYWYGVSTSVNNGAYTCYTGSVSRGTGQFMPKMDISYIEPGVAKPKNLTASNIGKRTATLSWDAVDGADSYELYYSTSSTKPSEEAIATVSNLTTTTHNLTGLTTGETYYAYVRAVADGEKSRWSAACKFTPGLVTETVNDGTSINSYVPFGTYNLSSYANEGQFIVPKATFEAAGITGDIAKLVFYNQTENSNLNSPKFQVYLRETDNTSISYFDYSDTTLVFNDYVAIEDHKMVIEFSKPFEYSGEKNLLIGFKRSQSASSNISSWYNWYGVNSGITSNCARSYASNSNSSQTFLPKMDVAYVLAGIAKPKNLTASNVTKNSATITWDEVAEADGYELSYSTTAGYPDNGTKVSLTDNEYSLTGLTSEVNYFIYVRAVKDGEKGKWSDVCAITPSMYTLVTVNDGTNTNTAVPVMGTGVSATNFTQQTQYIVLNTGLSELVGKSIRKLTFYSSQSDVSWGSATFDVSMMMTTNTQYSSATYLTGLTKVYSGSLSVVNGKMSILFDTPFEYSDGTKNLVIEVKRTAAGTNSNVNWLGTTRNYSSIWKNANATFYQDGYSPKVSFGYIPAITVTQDGFTFEMNDDKNAFFVTGYDDSSATPTVPSSVTYESNSYPVTAIGENALKNHTSLTEITIPSSITAIGADAFAGCTNIEWVTFQGTTIPTWADGTVGAEFATAAAGATWFVVPEAAVTDYKAAYTAWADYILKQKADKPSITEVTENGFTYRCVSIPLEQTAEATVIGYNGASTTPAIPATISYGGTTYTVNAIADDALKNNTSITEITIPGSVTSIGADAFAGCTNIEWVTFQGTTIPTWADGTVGAEFATAIAGTTWFVVPEAALSNYKGTYTAWASYILKQKSDKPIVTNVTVGDFTYRCFNDPVAGTMTANITAYNGSATAFDLSTIPATVNNAGNDYTISLPVNLSVFEGTSVEWLYTTTGSDVTINKYLGSATELIIPATMGGNNVANIAAGAFQGKINIWKVTFESTTPPTWADGNVGAEFGTPDNTYIIVDAAQEQTFKTAYPAWAEAIITELPDVNNSDFQFNCFPGQYTAVVYGYTGSGGDIKIPGRVVKNGVVYTVTQILKYPQDGTPFAGNTTITGITIPNTVSQISNNVFQGCTGLETVSFPYSPEGTTIASSAFEGCTSLASLTLPEGLTTIGSSAFYNCSALTTVTIPSTVTSISYSFSGCSGVTTAIFLPTTPPTWDDANTGYQFNGCANTKLVVPQSENNTVLQAYQTAYPAWYNANAITTSLDNYITVNGLKYAVIEGTSTAKLVGYTADVPAAAVIAASVSNGTDNYTVTTIDEDALKNCTAITSLTIPATVTTISGDPYSSPFLGCTNVTEVHFLGTEPPTWGNEAFKTDFNTPAHTALFVPAAALSTYQSTYTAWMASIYAEGTTIPDLSVFTFGNYAGSGTEYLCTLTGYSGSAANVAIPEYVYYSGTTYKVNAIANEVFKNHTEMTSITIPASVATVGTSAFEGCTGLTAVAIPYSGDHPMISGSAFKGCTSLASVTLPAQLEYISASMFENCSSLTGITLPSTALRFIQSAAFKNSGLTSITLPASLSKDNSGRITRTAFAGCNNLTDVYFEACTVWNDGTNDTQGPAASEFATTANTTLHVPSNSQDETWFLGSYVEWFNQIASDNLFTVGNFRYRHLQSSGGQDYLEVISYLGTEDATVAVPASVTAPNNETYPVVNIGENVFANHTEITQVVLPESIAQVGLNAFAGMDNLGVLIVKNWETTFAIPLDASNQFGPNTVIVQPIANLSNNNLGRVISSRPGTRFYSGNHYEYPFVFNCYQNDDDDYVAMVTSYIANDQATVNVPATVTDPTTNTVYAVNQLPEGLFLDHTEVTSVSAPGVTILGTFADGRYRGGYVFPETITSLSLPALVNIPDAAFPTGSISGEWMGAFQRLTNLQSITLTNVQYVGTDAFTGLTNLTTLNLPSVTTLTDHAIINMENCTINMPNCTTITDTMAIAGLKNCTINIPSVTDLRGVALVGVDRLWTNTVENVTINAPGLISIAPGAFKPCTIGTEGIDLSGATLNFDNLENVGNGAFFKTKIGSLTMEKIVSIGDSAFMHAELPNVKIPQTMTSIGKKAFFDCCMDVLRWYSNVDIPDSCFAYNYCMEYATVGDVVVGDFDSTTQSYATTTVGPATIGDGAFMACPFLKDINIGNSVKHLGKNFLKYGRALTQLIIPSTVETIGDGFIQGCDHLRKVYLFNQPAELGGETDDKPIYTIATEGSQAKERDTVYVYSGTTGEVVDTVVYMYDRVIPETFSKKYIHSFMPSANYYVNDGGGLNALIENGFHIGHNDGLFDYVNVNQVRSKSIYYGHLQWNQQSDHYSIHVAVIDSIKPYYNVRYIDGTTSANGVNTYGNENNIMSRLLPTYKLDAQDEPLTGLNVKRLARAGWSKYWTRERAEGVSEYSETNVNPAEHVNNCTFYVLNDETYHRYLNATNVNGEKVWERLDSLSAYNLAGTDGWAHYTGYEMTDELRDKYFQTFSTWSSTGLGLGGYSTDDNDGKVFSQWRRIHPLPNGVYCYPPFTSTQRFTLDGDEYYGYGIGTDFIMPKISLYNRVKREVDARGGAVNYAKWEWSSENLGPGWQPWIDWKNAIGIAYNENYTIVEKDTFNIDYDNHAVQSGYNISELVAWGDGLESPNYPLLGKSGPQIKWQTPCLGNGEATSFGDNYMYTIYFREKNFPHATGTPGEEGFEWGGYRNKYQMVPRADTIPPGWTPTILTPNVPEQSVVAVLRRCTVSETVKNGKNITNYSVHFEIVPKSEWWNNEKYVGKPCLIKNQVPWEYRFEGEVENPYWTADSRVVVPVTQEDGGQEVEGMTLSMIGCKLDHYLDKDEFYCKSKTTTVNGKPYEALLFKLSKDYGTVMVKQFGAYFRLERDGIPVHDMTVSNSQMAPSSTSFLFNDDATGIDDDDDEPIGPREDSGVVIYDLQGRRISGDLKSLASGIYIVNGKKVLIKQK